MELSDYLKSLVRCPDELNTHSRPLLWKLTTELGISDKWPIFLFADYDTVISDLSNSKNSDDLLSGKYRQITSNNNNSSTTSQGNTKKTIFSNEAGTVELHIQNSVTGSHYTYDYIDFKHNKRQKKEFNMEIILNLHYGKREEGINDMRAIAIAANDIGRYADTKGFGLCFPNSRGRADYTNLTRIVYLEPRK